MRFQPGDRFDQVAIPEPLEKLSVAGEGESDVDELGVEPAPGSPLENGDGGFGATDAPEDGSRLREVHDA